MKVLFAVDGSEHSLAAVGQVSGLLSAGRDEVVLYCSPPAIARTTPASSQDVLDRARQGVADAIFDEARKRLPAELQAGAHALTGKQDPRRGIVAAAEQCGAELIVMGARGLGTFERLLLGSVSRAVVHAAKVPVWVARTRPGRPAGQGMKVLLACENPDRARHPAEVLCRFTWPSGSACRTLTVVPSMFAGKVPDWLEQQARSPDVEAMVQAWAREHDEELRAMRAQMAAFAAALPAGCPGGEPLVAEGEPSQVVLSTIQQENADLVALGHYRKNWLSETLLGSTADAVLHHASCSVLVVPHQQPI
jgi:nucleotide-binding universal stress UspA family protein